MSIDWLLDGLDEIKEDQLSEITPDMLMAMHRISDQITDAIKTLNKFKEEMFEILRKPTHTWSSQDKHRHKALTKRLSDLEKSTARLMFESAKMSKNFAKKTSLANAVDWEEADKSPIGTTRLVPKTSKPYPIQSVVINWYAGIDEELEQTILHLLNVYVYRNHTHD